MNCTVNSPIQTSVGIVGIIGNVITMMILSCGEMRNSFNDLLTFLSLFDIMFITITIMDYSLIRGEGKGKLEGSIFTKFDFYFKNSNGHSMKRAHYSPYCFRSSCILWTTSYSRAQSSSPLPSRTRGELLLAWDHFHLAGENKIFFIITSLRNSNTLL